MCPLKMNGSIVYSIYPRGFKDKIRDVPHDPADPNETLVTITRFMKSFMIGSRRRVSASLTASQSRGISLRTRSRLILSPPRSRSSRRGMTTRIKDARMIQQSVVVEAARTPPVISGRTATTTPTVLVIALN